MAKTITVVVAQGLKYKGEYPAIGDKIEIDTKEAKRLLELGAVVLPPVAIDADESAAGGKKGGGKGPQSPAASDADLIGKIEAAKTLEELQALLTADEPSAAVAEAAQKRWVELELDGQ